MYHKRNKELRILELYLSDYSREFYLREISKLSKTTLRTTQRLLIILEQEQILKSELHGKNKYYSLNLDNIETKFYILKAELQKTLVFLEKYPLFKMFLNELKGNALLIIFGSYAKLLADKDSDIDILAISNDKIEMPSHLVHNELHLVRISEEDFIKSVKKGETLIKKVKGSHVILNNHSFFVDIMWGESAR